MSEKESAEFIPLTSAHGSNRDTESETRIMIQKEVHKQMISYFAPLIRQLEDLTPRIQWMSTADWPNFSPRAGTSANSNAAGPSPDFVTRGTGVSPDSHIEHNCSSW